jgi:hypothetical protein
VDKRRDLRPQMTNGMTPIGRNHSSLEPNREIKSRPVLTIHFIQRQPPKASPFDVKSDVLDAVICKLPRKSTIGVIARNGDRSLPERMESAGLSDAGKS